MHSATRLSHVYISVYMFSRMCLLCLQSQDNDSVDLSINSEKHLIGADIETAGPSTQPETCPPPAKKRRTGLPTKRTPLTTVFKLFITLLQTVSSLHKGTDKAFLHTRLSSDVGYYPDESFDSFVFGHKFFGPDRFDDLLTDAQP